MKQVRLSIPVIGSVALAAMFLKLPESPALFGSFWCKACSTSNPYQTLLSAGYFAFLVALSLLFPTFPNRQIARGGLIWALLLAMSLTYINLPGWCIACLIAHLCNILIWTIWATTPSEEQDPSSSPFRERLYLTCLAPILIVALFSCLNLTFMAYNYKESRILSATSLRTGDLLPPFIAKTYDNNTIANTDASQTKGMIINFITPDCPYCVEQLPILHAVAAQLANESYRFINISPVLPQEAVEQSPAIEWIEDKDHELQKLFKVSGYPTLFVVGTDGKIVQVISGVPEHLKVQLLTSLKL